MTRYFHHPESDSVFAVEEGESLPDDPLLTEIDLTTYVGLRKQIDGIEPPLPRLYRAVEVAREREFSAQFIDHWPTAKKEKEQWAEIARNRAERYEKRVRDLETFI